MPEEENLCTWAFLKHDHAFPFPSSSAWVCRWCGAVDVWPGDEGGLGEWKWRVLEGMRWWLCGTQARRASHLDEGVVQQRARGPPLLGIALQAVLQEVLPLGAQLLRDRWLVSHSHLVHDLEVVLILVPGSLIAQGQGGRQTGREGQVNVHGCETQPASHNHHRCFKIA